MFWVPVMCLILIIDCEVKCYSTDGKNFVLIVNGIAEGSTCDSDIKPKIHFEMSTYNDTDTISKNLRISNNITCEYGFGCAREDEIYYFTWTQIYVKRYITLITLPQIEAKHSKFTMGIEKFDNNSIVTSNFTAYAFNTDHTKRLVTNNPIKYFYTRKKISVPNYDDNYNIPIYKYNKKNPVYFTCEQYKNPNTYVYVGIVDINNVIQMLKTKKVTAKFMRKDNGSMLCCVIYKIDNEKGVLHIRRYVKKKSMLYYDNAADNNMVVHDENKTSLLLTTDPPAEMIDKKKDGVSTLNICLIVLLPTVLTSLVVVLVIILLKKYRWNKSETKVPPLPIDFEVFYVNSLFRKECEQELQAIDEIYEEIR